MEIYKVNYLDRDTMIILIICASLMFDFCASFGCHPENSYCFAAHQVMYECLLQNVLWWHNRHKECIIAFHLSH